MIYATIMDIAQFRRHKTYVCMCVMWLYESRVIVCVQVFASEHTLRTKLLFLFSTLHMHIEYSFPFTIDIILSNKIRKFPR